jgi:hypothetical protein
MAKQGIRFNRDQLDFLRDAKGKLAKASADTVASVGKFALGAIMTNVTYRAFSSDELANRNHPYARRHGSIQSAAIGTRPPYAVGRNTGNFAKSIQGRTTNQYEYAITYKDTPIAKIIVQGTRIMLPRNPITETVASASFQAMFKKAMINTFNKKVKGNG